MACERGFPSTAATQPSAHGGGPVSRQHTLFPTFGARFGSRRFGRHVVHGETQCCPEETAFALMATIFGRNSTSDSVSVPLFALLAPT